MKIIANLSLVVASLALSTTIFADTSATDMSKNTHFNTQINQIAQVGNVENPYLLTKTTTAPVPAQPSTPNVPQPAKPQPKWFIGNMTTIETN